jgi:hypothetical protein
MMELKPCPFCGGKAERKRIKPYRKIRGLQTWLAYVGCISCSATTQQASHDPHKAWEYAERHWNRRAD